MAHKLSVQEIMELQVLTRYLALKAVQIIVQSRLGIKVTTECKPPPTPNSTSPTPVTDRFNLAVPDDTNIHAKTKDGFTGELNVSTPPLCVEISLVTPEDERMILELWCLKMTEPADPLIKIMPTVYNRMVILLKSLVSVTRVTPAYKLSRRQGEDSYFIHYRVYMADPPVHTLAEGHKNIRIGQICTPIGVLQLSLAYRTKMTISPTQIGREDTLMVKSDHFNTNFKERPVPDKEELEDGLSMGDRPPFKIGAFADPSLIENMQESKKLYPIIDFKHLKVSQKKKLKPKRIQEEGKKPAEEPKLNPPPAPIKPTEETNGNNGEETKREAEKKDPEIVTKSTIGDFLMVDLKPPFANETNTSEIRRFYTEAHTAPPIFNEGPTIAEEDVTQILERYESDLASYDEVIKSFFESSSPNNN